MFKRLFLFIWLILLLSSSGYCWDVKGIIDGSTYSGSNSIIIVGAVNIGTWQGDPVDIAHGGTNLAAIGIPNGILISNSAGNGYSLITTDNITLSLSSGNLGILSPLSIAYGGTNLTTIGSPNMMLMASDTGNSLTYKSLQASVPLNISGTANTIAIGLPVANASTNGYLSATDWSAFNNDLVGGGNVTVDGFTIINNGGTLEIADRIEKNTMLNAFRIGVGMSFVTPNNMIDGIVDNLGGSNGISLNTSGCLSTNNGGYTACDTYTSFLLHADSTLADSSGYRHNITNIGTTVGSANKFGGGAGYYNGQGLLSLAATNDLQFGSGNFTVEMWVKGTANAQMTYEQPLFTQWQYGTNYDNNNNYYTHTLPAAGSWGGAATNGYIYFTPYGSGNTWSRYNTNAGLFSSAGAWNTYNLGGSILTVKGCTIVGTKMICSSSAGNFVQLDTTADFTAAGSWTQYASGLGHGINGTFDGRYIYWTNGAASNNVIRYDTTQALTTAGAWNTYAVGSNYGDCSTFDGTYLYVAPGNSQNFLRYNTTQNFVTAGSWNVYNLAGANTDYYGCNYDGKYVYFSTGNGGSAMALPWVRLDTTKDFTALSAWTFYSPPLSNYLYKAGIYDGKQIMYISQNNNYIATFDTTKDVTDVTAWQEINNAYLPAGVGYYGIIYDGRYAYFTPANTHAVTTQLDLSSANSAYKLLYNTSIQSGAGSGGDIGVKLNINAGGNYYTLISPIGAVNNSSFHHIAVVRNGNALTMYIDGVVKATKTITGAVNLSTKDITIGAYAGAKKGYDGNIDEVRISKDIARYTADFSGSLPASAFSAGAYNMTLAATNTTADTAPTKARLIVFEEDTDSVTIGTDLKGYVSNNGGANLYEVTLTDEGNYQNGRRILSGTANFVGAGNKMQWQIKTYNNKECTIHGVGCTWN